MKITNRYWETPEGRLKEQLVERDTVIHSYRQFFTHLHTLPWFMEHRYELNRWAKSNLIQPLQIIEAPPNSNKKSTTLIVEKIVEKVVEIPYTPKNFHELLHSHEHQWGKGRKGQTQCVICGLYKVAYQILNE